LPLDKLFVVPKVYIVLETLFFGYLKTKNDLTKAMISTFGSGMVRDQQFAESGR